MCIWKYSFSSKTALFVGLPPQKMLGANPLA